MRQISDSSTLLRRMKSVGAKRRNSVLYRRSFVANWETASELRILLEIDVYCKSLHTMLQCVSIIMLLTRLDNELICIGTYIVICYNNVFKLNKEASILKYTLLRKLKKKN